MIEGQLHELWYRPGLEDRRKSFKSSPTSISIKVDPDTTVSFSTHDDEPYHAALKKTDLESWQTEVPVSFEEMFSLYQIAAKEDPKNLLTHLLENAVIKEIHRIQRNLNGQIESANTLEAQIKFSHGQDVSMDHP